MHALAAVNTPIRGWKVYQIHSEYRMLMVDGESGGDLSDDVVDDAG